MIKRFAIGPHDRREGVFPGIFVPILAVYSWLCVFIINYNKSTLGGIEPWIHNKQKVI